VPDVFNNPDLNLFSVVLGIIIAILFTISDWKSRMTQLKYKLEVSSFGLFVVKNVIFGALFISLSYVLATYQGIPNILVILFFLILIYSFISNRTVIGRHIFAVGGNLKAAALSGIKTKKVTFLVFVNMGMLAAVSGLIFAARLNSATPKAGNLFELDAIAACFIGGASAYGGVGTVGGAMIGGLVMGVMNNGMSIIGMGIDWQQAIKGLVLLAAVGFDIYNKNRAA
jgi:putative multiple sugar transport system permease protein